jgi:hypothetical protein
MRSLLAYGGNPKSSFAVVAKIRRENPDYLLSLPTYGGKPKGSSAIARFIIDCWFVHVRLGRVAGSEKYS